MGWPKGVPRIGYIRKDGQPAAKRGERKIGVRTEPKPYTQTATEKDVQPKVRKWSVPLAHPNFQLLADFCPKCQFPEAEGGYCPNCGWHEFVSSCRHCTKGVSRD